MNDIIEKHLIETLVEAGLDPVKSIETAQTVYRIATAGAGSAVTVVHQHFTQIDPGAALIAAGQKIGGVR